MELTLDQALQKGVEAHKAGKIQEADRYYTAILKANPKHPDANHNMGVLAVSIGKFEEALPFFKIALEANPSIAQFWLSYINAYIKLDRMVDAKVVFNQAKSSGAKGNDFDQLEKRLSDFPEITDNHYEMEIINKAIDLRERGKYEEAIDMLLHQTKQSPKDPNIPVLLSHCYILTHNLEQAKIFLEAAKKINPDIPSVGWAETRLLLKQNRVKEALTLAHKTNKLFPENVEGMGVLGTCLRLNDSLDESLKYLNKAIELNPNYAEAFINRGLIYLSKKDKANSLNDLERAHNLKPHIKQIWDLILQLKIEAKDFENTIALAEEMVKLDAVNETIYASMALCHQCVENYDQAAFFYKKAIDIKPDYVDAWVNLGSTLKKQGQLDEAKEAYTKAITINPDNIAAYYNMGNVLGEQGKLPEALQAYNKTISINPEFAKAYNSMGNVLREQGKLVEALKAFNQATSINPEFAKAFNNMGNTLQDQNRIEQAIEAYTSAVNIEPNYAEAYHNMGNAFRRKGKLEKAIKIYNKSLSIKPNNESAKYLISALTGNTPKTAPREYVEHLFDDYANIFDVSLVDNLEYKIPKLIRDILIKPNRNGSLGSVLDLGCGTGLLGAEIRNHCSNLEGIDLSSRMLEVAKQKNVYDKLNQSDILEYLSSKPLDFDYYIALDVFIYIGELTEIFRLIKSRNKQPAHLVFSTEHSDLDGYHILKSGRYSHSKTYIESLCKKFDYNLAHFSTADLRKEKEHFLTGGIYILNC